MSPRKAPPLNFTPTPEGFRREDLTEARIAEIGRELSRLGGHRIAGAHDREASRRAVVGEVAPGEDVWVFGYGSLMWNPALDFAEAEPGRVHGYHRAFCLWTPFGRGSPEHPGLMLALRPGGSCLGLALRIPAKRAPDVVERFLKLYEADRNDGEEFNAFFDRVGGDPFTASIQDLLLPPEFSVATMQEFIDWERDGLYVLERGEGECAV